MIVNIKVVDYRFSGELQKGREGIEEAWEKSDEFHELWKLKARDILGRNAYRNMKLTKRVRLHRSQVQSKSLQGLSAICTKKYRRVGPDGGQK